MTRAAGQGANWGVRSEAAGYKTWPVAGLTQSARLARTHAAEGTLPFICGCVARHTGVSFPEFTEI